MKLAVVGVTGLVGSVILEVLEETGFQYDSFLPVASERSIGKKIILNGKEHSVIGLAEAVSEKPDIAIFSAGGSTSKEWAPRFAQVGTTVIDNSSAWRMDPTKKLVVPEINAHELTLLDKIIANPNCSTIQMVLPLAPLHTHYRIKRLVISTYQSFTGTGVKAVDQYTKEKDGKKVENPAYPHPIFENCLPHCDVFFENGYTREELKLVNETKKILGDDGLRITATAVRVPVHGGHSESINVEFYNEYNLSDVKNILANTPGIILQDDPANNIYPMPAFAKNKNDVFVGRIRRDESTENGMNLWVVADNLRKGAATNAVQIAQYLVNHNILNAPTPA
jgi:aspartate-semialdehyde dehydrogenase